MKKIIGILGAALMLQGCAAFKQGTYQSLHVTTSPPHALCNLYNAEGAVFSSLTSNGRIYNLRRGRQEVTVTCSKAGYADASAVLTPTTDGEAGSLMFVTAGVDVLLGTNMTYPDSVNLVLQRN